MGVDIERLLYEGAVAVTEGRLADAQGLLMQVIEHDEQNELAWLWLSGAVEDPADQQVALENVLALNPNNQAARQGLAWLQAQYDQTPPVDLPPYSAPAGGAADSEWVPPPPRDADEVEELVCWQCNATLYSVAEYCWQCHAPVHACNNCTFRLEPRCKELQGLTSTMSQHARNSCPWWRP